MARRSPEHGTSFKRVRAVTGDHLWDVYPLKSPEGVGGSCWIALQDEGKIVAEGVLSFPQEDQKSSLLFLEPGLTAGASLSLYKCHTPALVRQGHHVLTLRHLGTSLNGLPELIQCDACLEYGRIIGRDVLGEQGKKYNVKEIVSEVSAALNIVGKHFNHITVVGHSAGSMAISYCLANGSIDRDVVQRIDGFLSIGGFTGGTEHVHLFPPLDRVPVLRKVFLREYFRLCGSEGMELVSPWKNIRLLEEIFKTVYENKIPEHIVTVHANAANDEVIPPSAAEEFCKVMGRGIRIIDHAQYTYAHGFQYLSEDIFLKLLKILQSKDQGEKRLKRAALSHVLHVTNSDPTHTVESA